jgi:hypothetical protein
VAKRLADGTPGQQIIVTYFRQDRLGSATLKLVPNPERKWVFSVRKKAPNSERRLRHAWLGVAENGRPLRWTT